MNCGGADGQPPGIDLDNSSVDAASLMADMTGSPLEQAIGRENLERYEVALSELRQEEREAIIGRIEMDTATRSSPGRSESPAPTRRARPPSVR